MTIDEIPNNYRIVTKDGSTYGIQHKLFLVFWTQLYSNGFKTPSDALEHLQTHIARENYRNMPWTNIQNKTSQSKESSHSQNIEDKQNKLAKALGLVWKEVKIAQWFKKDEVPDFSTEQPQLINLPNKSPDDP